ncbi:antitoxin Xre/MbcA/ParS toxin-binding domain-containing protein [Alteromonas naphthalenivorans]|uniref:Uncharacterized protein n=1 Tax=Alteromonas naphthalenivorans TaxID=715451 RepID=F5Z5L8_ALTNA|nr:antitoxin Xre/MbcA/ParS toxin-binding domain-containing protein [Alteromonas naphthalenivorans]AEF05023.1 hypothetical protein ambt_17605 [Alteromonas naphthalenivorans]
MLEFIPQKTTNPSVWERVGIPERGSRLHDAIHRGLPFDVYHRIAKVSLMDKAEIAHILHLAPATLSRRAKEKRFKVEEGDKFFRLAELISAATELFEGDEAKAIAWLKKPAKGLGNKRPIDMAATSAEAKAVLDLIGQLEHGVFA